LQSLALASIQVRLLRWPLSSRSANCCPCLGPEGSSTVHTHKFVFELIYVNFIDPQLLQDVSRLLAQSTANRTRTKSSAVPTPAGSPKVVTPASSSRPSRAYTTSIPTSPITPSRSATSSLKSPLTSPSKRHTLPAVPTPPQRSTEALVTHDPPLPPPSTSKLPLDWSTQQPEEVAPQRRRRRFSLTRRPKKDQQTGSDTGGEDADALEGKH